MGPMCAHPWEAHLGFISAGILPADRTAQWKLLINVQKKKKKGSLTFWIPNITALWMSIIHRV